MTLAQTFDDVLLVPQYSTILSRSDVDLSVELGPLKLQCPIIPANMSTIVSNSMVGYFRYTLGGMAWCHRFKSNAERLEAAYLPQTVGITGEERDLMLHLYDAGCKDFCIDVAHGDHQEVVRTVKLLASLNVKSICAGNIVTVDAAHRLIDAGANILKLGCGPGSLCSTRLVTGHGYPQFSVLQNFVDFKSQFSHVGIIADGGFNYSGDMVKALASTADACMTGSLIAGTDLTPGPVIKKWEGFPFKRKQYKKYIGMASIDAQQERGSDYRIRNPEGVSRLIPYKGQTVDVVEGLLAGIKSGCSYSGAHNLQELKQNAKFVSVSANTLIENRPRHD